MSQKQLPQNPLVLRYHRLMDAFTKSDDERHFYVDKYEGFILYLDLGKPQKELDVFLGVLHEQKERFRLIPRFTFYETKKIMEGFVNEKVYDIDTKEKLTDLIQSRDSKELFLEFLYDHHHEQEKWQLYYQERCRVRIIEWLRSQEFDFVFEEDLELTTVAIEKVKRFLFDPKPPKDVVTTRQALKAKAKTYYSSEALNPRPKRGRPPKQVVKIEVEPKVSLDIYTTVTPELRPFLYVPDITCAASITFSSKYESQEEFLASLKGTQRTSSNEKLEELSKRLASLQDLSVRLAKEGYEDAAGVKPGTTPTPYVEKKVAKPSDYLVKETPAFSPVKEKPVFKKEEEVLVKPTPIIEKSAPPSMPKKKPVPAVKATSPKPASSGKQRLRTLTKKEDKPKKMPVRRLRKIDGSD